MAEREEAMLFCRVLFNNGFFKAMIFCAIRMSYRDPEMVLN